MAIHRLPNGQFLEPSSSPLSFPHPVFPLQQLAPLMPAWAPAELSSSSHPSLFLFRRSSLLLLVSLTLSRVLSLYLTKSLSPSSSLSAPHRTNGLPSFVCCTRRSPELRRGRNALPQLGSNKDTGVRPVGGTWGRPPFSNRRSVVTSHFWRRFWTPSSSPRHSLQDGTLVCDESGQILKHGFQDKLSKLWQWSWTKEALFSCKSLILLIMKKN